ncbi:MAG: LacI family DNA-binding transcriptional regulator [Actinobacteria bacterium]|nr:LacI family DNA-binding transcriptional regulator [Actinomycetota bacterium]
MRCSAVTTVTGLEWLAAYANTLRFRTALREDMTTDKDEPPTSPSKRPTIADVARLAGVSKGSVSHVFNDRSDIGVSTRLRILAAAEELGWRPNAAAIALSRARAMSIGLIMSRSPELLSSDPFFPELLAGIEQVLAPKGYALLLHMVSDEGPNERQAYKRLAEAGRVDGVLLTDSRVDDPRYLLVTELNLPAIIIGRVDGKTSIPWVDDPQQDEVVAESVTHLISLGHRRIAYVSGPDRYVHGHRRREAFESALRSHSLRSEATISADFTAAGGAKATSEILESASPTAIIYANDVMAVAGMGVAQERGLNIPADLSIIGFDDEPLARWTRPALTTVRYHIQAQGAIAATALLRLLDGETFEYLATPRNELIIRESTAAAPS